MADSPLSLTCPGCGAALVPMLPFGEKEWQYSHPWPSGCTEAGKPAAVRKEAVRMVAKLTGTATAVSCWECGSGLVPEMVSREVGWVYEHKAGGCRWTGKRFKVVGMDVGVEMVEAEKGEVMVEDKVKPQLTAGKGLLLGWFAASLCGAIGYLGVATEQPVLEVFFAPAGMLFVFLSVLTAVWFVDVVFCGDILG